MVKGGEAEIPPPKPQPIRNEVPSTSPHQSIAPPSASSPTSLPPLHSIDHGKSPRSLAAGSPPLSPTQFASKPAGDATFTPVLQSAILAVSDGTITCNYTEVAPAGLSDPHLSTAKMSVAHTQNVVSSRSGSSNSSGRSNSDISLNGTCQPATAAAISIAHYTISVFQPMPDSIEKPHVRETHKPLMPKCASRAVRNTTDKLPEPTADESAESAPASDAAVDFGRLSEVQGIKHTAGVESLPVASNLESGGQSHKALSQQAAMSENPTGNTSKADHSPAALPGEFGDGSNVQTRYRAPASIAAKLSRPRVKRAVAVTLAAASKVPTDESPEQKSVSAPSSDITAIAGVNPSLDSAESLSPEKLHSGDTLARKAHATKQKMNGVQSSLIER